MPADAAFGFDISGWHCNRKTRTFATKAARFLSKFVDHCGRSGMSDGRLRRIRGSAWEIGYVISRRGFYDKFTPAILADPKAIVDLQRRRAHFTLTESFKKTWKMVAEYVAQAPAA